MHLRTQLRTERGSGRFPLRHIAQSGRGMTAGAPGEVDART